MSLSDYYQLLKFVGDHAERLQLQVYLVGGTVRDSLLGLTINQGDLDFTVAGDAVALAQAIAAAQSGQLKIFDKFRTAKVLFDQSWCGVKELDFVSTRKEIYQQPGSLPTVTAGTLEEDLQRRDFSINTLACAVHDLTDFPEVDCLTGANLRARIIDRHNGLSDLDNRIIRILHPTSFIDDPTRIFRAARYQVRINGKLDDCTCDCLKSAVKAAALRTISRQRALREIELALEEVDAVAVLQLLSDWQVLSELGWLPASYSTEFLSKWAAIESGISRAYEERMEFFKMTCVLYNPEQPDQHRAESLLVSERKFKNWKRSLALIYTGKLERLSDTFLKWAKACNLFDAQQTALDAEIKRRNL